MDKKNLKQLIKANFTNVPNANFSKEEANSAAVNAIFEAFNLSADATFRDIRPIAPEVMALIEETVDEVLPARLTDVMGSFAEIKTFARDAEVIFKIGKLGQRRARLTIAKGARGGIYRAARLDSDVFQMPVHTETVGVFITLEDILLGRTTLAELFANILEGFEELIYVNVVNALIAGHTSVTPAANRKTIQTGTLTLEAALDDCIKIAKAYGNPMIFGFYDSLAKISNVSTVGTPNRATADVDDIRNQGYVQIYKGVKLVEIPNYLKDNNNAEWLLNSNYIFVLPTDAKPVKVAFKGDLTIVENKQDSGSEKWNAHKMVGVGLALANSLCVIKVQ